MVRGWRFRGVPPSSLRARCCELTVLPQDSDNNAPNFMVKSVAEEAGVKMPSFFGYMAYSTVILFPLFFVVTWIFF